MSQKGHRPVDGAVFERRLWGGNSKKKRAAARCRAKFPERSHEVVTVDA